MVTRILCFGDSQVWGYIPGTDHERFSSKERFPKLLQKLLGSNYEVIEEGLNSRTLISEDKRPNKEGRKGSTYLIPCLYSHDPLDLVILMLGTNELKHEFKNTPEQIGKLLGEHFVKIILNRKSQIKDHYTKSILKLIIISPPIINEKTRYAHERYIGGTEKSKQLGKIYSKIAKTNKCGFVDASNLDVGPDGVHMTKESHAKLAKILANKIKKLKQI